MALSTIYLKAAESLIVRSPIVFAMTKTVTGSQETRGSGQAITIFANVGVILGIVLLAYELHQNNELLESQANLVLLENRLAALFSSNPGMGKLWSDEGVQMRFSSDFVLFMNENIVRR